MRGRRRERGVAKIVWREREVVEVVVREVLSM